MESGVEMIDTGEGNWTEQADGRDLRFCTSEELTGMGAIERVSRWHGCTLGEARDAIGRELLRRTQTTDYAKG
jgi:hypothetical protein